MESSRRWAGTWTGLVLRLQRLQAFGLVVYPIPAMVGGANLNSGAVQLFPTMLRPVAE